MHSKDRNRLTKVPRFLKISARLLIETPGLQGEITGAGGSNQALQDTPLWLRHQELVLCVPSSHHWTAEETKSHIPPDPCNALRAVAPHLHSSGASWRTGSPKAKYTFNSPSICLLIDFRHKRFIFWALRLDLLDTTRQRISLWGPQFLVISVFKCPFWIKCV